MSGPFEGLRPPPGGWPEGDPPFLAYADAQVGVNWSLELEALHERATARHPLDVLTRAAVLDALEDALPAEGSLLDLGCSSGHLLAEAHARRPDIALAGVDLVPAGLERAHARVPSASLLLTDAQRLPLCDATVDAVAATNLLEHVRDDEAVLSEIARVLRPGGRAALVVPAGPGLFDYYDALLGHERRYARGELACKAIAAGLRPEAESGLGTLLYPAFWAVKRFHRLRKRELSRAEMESRVRADIARSGGSHLVALACRIEGSLRARGVRPRAGIRFLIVLSRA